MLEVPLQPGNAVPCRVAPQRGRSTRCGRPGPARFLLPALGVSILPYVGRSVSGEPRAAAAERDIFFTQPTFIQAITVTGLKG